MTLEGIKEMELGAFVDYCIDWNEAHDDKKTKEVQRKATQYDWNVLLG